MQSLFFYHFIKEVERLKQFPNISNKLSILKVGKSIKNNKIKFISFRVTEQEYKHIQNFAQKKKSTVSKLMREFIKNIIIERKLIDK